MDVVDNGTDYTLNWLYENIGSEKVNEKTKAESGKKAIIAEPPPIKPESPATTKEAKTDESTLKQDPPGITVSKDPKNVKASSKKGGALVIKNDSQNEELALEIQEPPETNKDPQTDKSLHKEQDSLVCNNEHESSVNPKDPLNDKSSLKNPESPVKTNDTDTSPKKGSSKDPQTPESPLNSTDPDETPSKNGYSFVSSEDPQTDEADLSNESMPTSSYYENESWHSTMNMLSTEHYRALQMLTPEQLELLLKLVYTLRQQRIAIRQQMECRFCKTNGEAESWYSCHTLKDRRGRVVCPVLKAYTCPRCGATGTRAHTYKYCPFNNPI